MKLSPNMDGSNNRGDGKKQTTFTIGTPSGEGSRSAEPSLPSSAASSSTNLFRKNYTLGGSSSTKRLKNLPALASSSTNSSLRGVSATSPKCKRSTSSSWSREHESFTPASNHQHSKNSSVENDKSSEETFHDSKSRHPNFYKDDSRVSLSRPGSDIHLAGRADKKYSRYFIKHSNSARHLDQMEEPFYYFHSAARSSTEPENSTGAESRGTASQSSQSSGRQSAEKGKGSEATFLTMEVLEPYDYSQLNLDDMIMTEEEHQAMKREGSFDFETFKKHFFNWKFWRKNVNVGQFLATVALLALIVFGSVGFLVSTARNVYKAPPPEVHEILSPYNYPTLSAIRMSLVDPDTPKEAHTRVSAVTDQEWDLVFSDEFNAEGRTFFEGDDQFFAAQDIHYAATNDLEYYVPDMIKTGNGSLQITIDAFPTNNLDYRSGMLQSWNKLCFNKNAVVEVSMKMPGYSQSKGLWPAVWSLGNLARAGFQATTDGVWPYTYDECDFGITPNQSSPDGISFLPGQRLSKCTCFNQDHPSPGRGRGAPEIDVIEGTHDKYADWALGAQTLQVAPFDPWWRPDYDYMTIQNEFVTFMKEDTGTPTQEAIAAVSVLNDTWFDSVRNGTNHKQHLNRSTHFQKFGFEYMSEKRPDQDSYIQFFQADEATMTAYGDSLHPSGDIGWRHITREPMSLVFNLGLSPTWMDIDFASLEFPATLEIDYVRIYQPKGMHEMTCDPEDYPTVDYINQHLNAYTNVNLTTWEMAGYRRPRNSIMDGCEAPQFPMEP